MRLSKTKKKALSLMLSIALIITGVNIEGTKSKAADDDSSIGYYYIYGPITPTSGDGSEKYKTNISKEMFLDKEGRTDAIFGGEWGASVNISNELFSKMNEPIVVIKGKNINMKIDSTDSEYKYNEYSYGVLKDGVVDTNSGELEVNLSDGISKDGGIVCVKFNNKFITYDNDLGSWTEMNLPQKYSFKVASNSDEANGWRACTDAQIDYIKIFDGAEYKYDESTGDVVSKNETASPEESKEPETTASPEESKEPEATVEPEESKEPEATVNPEESKEPEATLQPEESKEPEATLQPQESKEPEATLEPDEPQDSSLYYKATDIVINEDNSVKTGSAEGSLIKGLEADEEGKVYVRIPVKEGIEGSIKSAVATMKDPTIDVSMENVEGNDGCVMAVSASPKWWENLNYTESATIKYNTEWEEGGTASIVINAGTAKKIKSLSVKLYDAAKPEVTAKPEESKEPEATKQPETTKIPETVEKHEISGKIATESDEVIANASIELKKGNTVLYSTTTDANGEYKLTDVVSGEYNLVATYGKKVISKFISINNQLGEKISDVNITFSNKDISSVVDVKGNETPAIVVGGLDEEVLKYGSEITSDSDALKLTMNVETKKEADIPKDAAAIKSLVEAFNKNLEFFDMNVLKKLNESEDNLTELNTVLQIIIPYDTKEKKNAVVFRKHGEFETIALKKLVTRPILSSDYEDGSYYLGDGFIVIYTNKFSTYAIGYDKTITVPSTPSIPWGSDSSGSTPAPTVSPMPTIEPTTVPAITAAPTVMPTVSPDITIVPTPEPEQTKTPEPTIEPTLEPIETPEPTVEPTKTPESTKKPETSKTKEDKSFSKLRLYEAASTESTIKLAWSKIKGADGYVLYSSRCNTKNKIYSVKQKKVVKGTSKIVWTHKGLKSGTFYKYLVRAYKIVDGKRVWIAKSKLTHIKTEGGKYNNPKKVKVNKKSLSINVGKKHMIKAVAIGKNIRIHRDICFESSDKNIATVDNKGRIKAVSAGKCKIYAYAQNGKYSIVKITVK